MSAISNSTDNPHEYNGWTNYPTWLVYSWVTNDEGIQALYAELAREGFHVLRDAVRDHCFSHVPEAELSTDLMLWALQHVNWQELTEALKDL